jgi:hypothetical protein
MTPWTTSVLPPTATSDEVAAGYVRQHGLSAHFSGGDDLREAGLRNSQSEAEMRSGGGCCLDATLLGAGRRLAPSRLRLHFRALRGGLRGVERRCRTQGQYSDAEERSDRDE